MCVQFIADFQYFSTGSFSYTCPKILILIFYVNINYYYIF
jgi:hypothetical protein